MLIQLQLNSNQNENKDEGLFGNQKISDYEIGKKIGQGSYAIVKLGLEKDTYRNRVLKIYEKYKLYSKSKRKNVINEIKNLQKLDHENIIKFITAMNTKKQIIIVTEYRTQTSLGQYLKKMGNNYYLEEDKAIQIFKQIVSAVAYMHSQKIAHRDIKLENILIDTNEKIKIIDFGFSVNFQQDGKKMKMLCGTPCYMAPEIVSKKHYDAALADVWAMGIVLYRILFGIFPFAAMHETILFQKIKKGIFNMHKTKDPILEELLTNILRVNPQQRHTAQEVMINIILQVLNDLNPV